MRQQGLILLCGPSGVGKSTLIHRALKDFTALSCIVSYTTRPKRPQEEDKKDYFFVTKEEFFEKEKQGEFVEWTHVYDYYYATSKKQILSCWEKGMSVVKDVDIKGLKSFKKVYPQSLAVGILASDNQLIKERIKKRSVDFGKAFDIRVQAQKQEITELKQVVDIQIINDELEKAYQDLKKEIEKYLYTK